MNIAIAGYGVEGESSYKYYSADSNNKITIVDQRELDRVVPDGASVVVGKDAFDKLQGYDLIVRTPSLSPQRINTDGKIWSATNEFFARCPAPIIGVTGSKGKGTTSSLVASILEKAGKKVWLVGNIGKPALDILQYVTPSDYVVYELSSFQLWDLEKSPHIAAVLFMEQEHLDVHSDMAEYINAKANITKYQTKDDLLVYNKQNQHAINIASTSPATKIGYTDINTANVFDNCFYYGEQKICSVDVLQINGKYHQDNACAAIDIVWNIVNDIEVIEQGLSAFKGLPHRLQLVRTVNGIKYYDDSIATTPSSAIADLRTFDGSKVIILGGSSKGSDFTDLAIELGQHDVKAILIGDEATNIAKACKLNGFNNFEIIDFESMEQVVRRAHDISKPNGVVLLSPASASFGLFKNYSDRGDKYIAAVNSL